jgi:alkylhydroperoxidase family enzyme
LPCSAYAEGQENRFEPRSALVKQAAVSDAQIVDLTLAVARIAFTNLFNRINDTVLDFPAVA